MPDPQARLTDRLLDVVIVCTLIAAALILLHARFTAKGFSPSASLVGTRADRVAGVDYREARFTVVFALRTSCSYCTSMLPAIRELIRRTKGAAGRPVAISPEPPLVLRLYLTRHGIDLDDIHQVAAHGRFAAFTPRVFLIGSDGVVRYDWLGTIDDSRMRQILDALRWF